MRLERWQRDRLWAMCRGAVNRDAVMSYLETLAAALLTLDGSTAFDPGGSAVLSYGECLVRIRRAFDEGPSATVVSIQRALRDGGYDPGPADGQWGPLTFMAFRRFCLDWAKKD